MTDNIADNKVYLNGVDGVTGDYLIKPMALEEAAALAKNKDLDASVLGWLKAMWLTLSQPHLGLPFFVNKPEDISQAGWSIVFHEDETEEVKKAMQPLIEHRAKQVSDTNKLKVLQYNSGEDCSGWLARHGIGAGTINPIKVPFYILLVGSPAQIPFTFGHLLDVEYAVGRLHFDSAEEYSNYVESVIAYESSDTIPNSKEAVFFAPRHPFDAATKLSADLLVKPLLNGDPVSGFLPITEYEKFQARPLTGQAATKGALAEVFSPKQASKPPAFLFSASHGMGWPSGHPKQLSTQGALLCQDWPGFGTIGPEHYFAASDLPADASVHGLLAFNFACYGAGTPERDRFFHKPDEPPPVIAESPFISALPKGLLSHPKGGALAVIGHVERAWPCSISTPNAGPQLTPFQNAIGRILKGEPVGLAMKDFNERYAALSTNLTDLQEKIGLGYLIADSSLTATWTQRNDAEGYVVLGDPAVRLRTADLA